MARTHYFPEDRVHYVWDNELEPAITVSPGDTVVYNTREVSDGQITPDSTADALATFDWDRVYPLSGPVGVEGAEPGDTLVVEVIDIHTVGWGWTAVIPGFGLLPEDFPDAYLKIFDLSNGDFTLFNDEIAIPIEPFFGTMGVNPNDPAKPAIMPPGPFGGNMDTRHITKGSVLYLPVQMSGALFSCGDAHAAQGDGEVCVTGIESPMYAALRFDLIKGKTIPAPQFQTPGALTPWSEGAGWYATMGVNSDLMVAAQDSLRAMVEHISTTYGLEPVEAYVLASLVVDLKISEIVDQPNWIVSSYLPLAIFS
ncbi:MAG TPA: acetamidase/formamidase family protein [Rubrobacteraceae bacterium]|nr:acetamidase/formamidase family protein [Rubrobacteraceae bacterium]